ncbi:MAG: hypothetical protein O2968_18045 [Acidobacteria bacterium]|nr:hypothetical protein [Acidobacteriota bacterium]
MKQFWTLALLLAIPTLLLADKRTNPPTVQKTSPLAVTRGLTTEIKIEGINLVGASSILFDDSAIQGKILHVNTLGEFVGRFVGSNGGVSTIQRGDPPPLNEVAIAVEVGPEAKLGLYSYRLVTKEGTTNTGKISVEPFYGARPEIEPNDTLQEALLQDAYVFPPAIISGTLRQPGDIDHLPFEALAGEEIVFHMTAAELGSALRWKIALLDGQGTTVASRSVVDGQREPVLAYRIPSSGKYFVAMSDIERGGSRDHFYRLKIGSYPYLTGVEPLGVPESKSTQISLRGYNLGEQRTLTIAGKSDYVSMARQDVRPNLDLGYPHNQLKIAVGKHPEVMEEERGADAASAMSLNLPVTVNGRVSGFSKDLAPDEDHFQFAAKKGTHYVIEIEARRLGSPLDSVLEVLDSKGDLVPQIKAHAELKTEIELRDQNSAQSSLRISAPEEKGFNVGDYVMIGDEILRISALPRGPDDGTVFTEFGGQRIGYSNTTPEAIALGTAVYKVSLHAPDAAPQPNGLPQRIFYYRNDDGGPGYGKDSLLNFTASEDGDYFIRLRDLRGEQGEDYGYRLTLREATPDFQLSVSPANPNLPRGGGATVTVTALRYDGFDGAIEVAARDLPPGLTATSETIVPGESSTVLTLFADAQANLEQAVPLQVVGRSMLQGKSVERVADADDNLRYIALSEPADLEVEVESEEVELEAGAKTTVVVRITRRNGFEGRVPIAIDNLPFGVRVTDVGLNGVLVTEEETRREFVLEALPDVAPTERLIAVSGTVETRSPIRPTYAAKPFKLRVVPRKMSRVAPGSLQGAASSSRSAGRQ